MFGHDGGHGLHDAGLWDAGGDHAGASADDAELAEITAAMGEGSGSGSGSGSAIPDEPATGGGGLVETPEDAPSWDDLVDGWEVVREAVYSGAIAGATLGFLSVYVVLRRMVFVSAAVTQAAGLGVALSFYASIHLGITFNPMWGATGLSLITAALLAGDPKRFGISREMVLGLVFALTAGAAVLVGSRITQEANDIQSILFGTAVVVSPEDLHRLAWTSAAVMLLQLWWFRGFAFASFDPTAAQVQGLPLRLLDMALLLSVGVMVGQAARALGAMPAFAMSTLPGMAALLLVRGPMIWTFVVASLIGAAVGVGGYMLAFFEEFPVGSAQTVTAALMVVVAAIIRIIAGVIVRVMRTRRAA